MTKENKLMSAKGRQPGD